ncbi:MAG: hypothetical protein PUD02_06410 [Eggerthellales bacterium]|nr:hypothetical protein [Eggerthellales bacterium]
MLWRYEFEVCELGFHQVLFPCDFDEALVIPLQVDCVGAFEEWLTDLVRRYAMEGRPMPRGSIANMPHRKGRVCVGYVDSSNYDEAGSVVRAAEAARMLGVTSCRVSQMIKSHQLEGYREGRKSWVTLASVRKRKATHPGPGRPKKQVG